MKQLRAPPKNDSESRFVSLVYGAAGALILSLLAGILCWLAGTAIGWTCGVLATGVPMAELLDSDEQMSYVYGVYSLFGTTVVYILHKISKHQ